jgi:hypothetical protein
MQTARIFKEPLLHFVLIGALLFGAAELRRPSSAETADRTISADDHLRRRLAEAWQSANGRPPSREELEQRVSQHIDQEILYREGIRRGLHKDDERIRLRVADKMAFVIRAQIVIGPPSEAELRKYFEAHRRKYERPALVDFVHVFVSGSDAAASKRALELLEKLRAGADPDGLGDRFSGGRRYRGRKLADLGQSFGPEFVQGMAEQPQGQWALKKSRLGFHLVRIEKKTPPKSPELAEVKLEVAKDWEADELGRRFEAKLAELRKSWTIRR